MEQKDGVPVLLLLERPHAAAKYRALGEASLDGDSLDSLGEADGGLVADPLHRRGEEPRETSSSSSPGAAVHAGGGGGDPDAAPA